MSSAHQATPQITSQDLMLTVLSGPETGVSYKLLGQSISLGRATDNDVVLQDTKSSRNHAVIELREGAYWIRDLGSQNGVLINGAAVREGVLRPGDQLTVGATQLRFGPPQALSIVNAAPPFPLSGKPQSWTKPRSTPQSDDTKKYAAIIGVVVIALGWMLLPKSKNASSSLHLKDEAALQAEMAGVDETNEKRQQEIMRKGKDTQQYSEAQAFYLRGFREFRENNYSRAIQNFEAALALYPEHPLAKRYLDRSRLKLNETVTATLERGEKAFQLQKYTNAFNEYRTVLILTNDPRNKSFQLAQKRIEAIKLILMNNK